MSDSSRKKTATGTKVRIKYLSVLRDKTHRSEEFVETYKESTLTDIVSYISDKYKISLPSPHVLLVLNGKGYNQYPDKLETKLKQGDTILILPSISGG